MSPAAAPGNNENYASQCSMGTTLSASFWRDWKPRLGMVAIHAHDNHTDKQQ